MILNPISPGVLGPGNTPGGGAQSAHTQFKGSKLLFDLETLFVLSEIYIDFTKKNAGKRSRQYAGKKCRKAECAAKCVVQ